MSTQDRKIILMCLDSEIAAVRNDISRSGPKRDWFGNKFADIREDHLGKLLGAKSAVEGMR